MSDNLKIRQPLDAKRINMNQAHEMAYWTRTLGISELYLRIVVNKVDDSVTAVKKYIGILSTSSCI